MAATEDADLFSDTETDVTYCPALETFSQVKRTQPQRNAKRDPRAMCRQRETIPIHVYKRLHDITCLLKDHLSGKNKVTARQARILLVELKKTRKNCTTLGRKTTQELSKNCKHLQEILADRGANDLSKSVENKKPQINTKDLALVDNQNIQFSCASSKLCPALKPEITDDLDKENVSNSPNIIRASGHDHVHRHVASYRHLKENSRSSVKLSQLSLNKTPRVFVNSTATLGHFDEKVHETCVQSQNEMNSLKSLELKYKRSPTSKKSISPTKKAQIQSSPEELFHENHASESMNKTQEGVISPACNSKLKSEVIVNAEKSGNLLLAQTAQTQIKENEIQIAISQQNCRNIEMLETATEVEIQTVPHPLYAKFAEGLNKRISSLNETTETKPHCEILNDLTYTSAASDNKISMAGIKKFPSTSLLPCFGSEKKISKAIARKRRYSWSEMSLDTVLQEAEEVVSQSCQVISSSPRCFGERCGIFEADFEYPWEEQTIYEEPNDLIRRLIDEGLISDVHILKEQNSANMYCLTDKDLVHIATKIKVPFEDLKRAIETVIRSDADSDTSKSIISASQSPTERRYSQSQTQSSEEKYKLSYECMF